MISPETISNILKNPLILMLIAVSLWAMYPPLVNVLVDELNLFQVAAYAHSIAAISTLIILVYYMSRQTAEARNCVKSTDTLRRLRYPATFSGLLIAANHLLLYAALNSSNQFDVLAILVFETWPILFFYIDTAKRRSGKATTVSDYVFSGAAFAGFVILMAPNMDMADWLLLEMPMLETFSLALLGGIAMAVNCYHRILCMDRIKNIAVNSNVRLPDFAISLVTESFVRTIAAPIFLIIALVFGTTFAPIGWQDLIVISFIGIFILSLGSALYDLSVFNATNASVGILWYLMPVGSIAILAAWDQRLLTQYEAVASALIVASNIFLSLRYPIKNSLVTLYPIAILSGATLLFIPPLKFNYYYELLSVSTVFFVLLASFMLERITSLNREREGILHDFTELGLKYVRLPRQATSDDCSRRFESETIAKYFLLNVFIFLGAFSQRKENRIAQKCIERTKNRLWTRSPALSDQSSIFPSLFRTGDRFVNLENNRTWPSEFVILSLLGLTNILILLLFRPENFLSQIFALLMTISVSYLLLIIYERHNRREIRPDHAVLCSHLLTRLGIHSEAAQRRETAEVYDRVRSVLGEIRKAPDGNRNSTWSFVLFAFVIVGFSYGFVYQAQERSLEPESSPFATHASAAPTITIGLVDWPSARLKAHILAKIIDEYTRIDGEVRPASHQAIFRQMSSNNGQIDVHPEFWVGNNPDLVRRYVRAFGSVALSEAVVKGRQGLCVTGAESRDRQISVTSLDEPTVADKFDISGDDRGDIWIGATGWASTDIERRRLEAYGLDDYYEFHTFSDQLLKRVLDSAVSENKPLLFFCYSPDPVLARPNVSMIQQPSHDSEVWRRIVEERDLDTLETGTSWPTIEIRIAYRKDLTSFGPEIAALLQNFRVPNNDVVSLLNHETAGVSEADLAERWIARNRTRILGWITGFQ